MTLRELINWILLPFNILAKLAAELLLIAFSMIMSAIALAIITLLALPLVIAVSIGAFIHSPQRRTFASRLINSLSIIISMPSILVLSLGILIPTVMFLTLLVAASGLGKALTGNRRSWTNISDDWKFALKTAKLMALFTYHLAHAIGKLMIGRSFTQAFDGLTHFPVVVQEELGFEAPFQGGDQAAFNYNQSAHRASVENDVKNALLRFKDKYSNLDKEALLNTLRQFKDTVRNSACDEPATANERAEYNRKKQSALHCIDRILDQNDRYMNAHPIHGMHDVTPRDAALMIFAHMQDQNNWLPNVTQKKLNDAFIDSLWHIQRANHIDENGIDTHIGEPDDHSCPGGTINFLFNDMQTVLKDITVTFISEKDAMFKLAAIARGQMLKDIASHPEDQKYENDGSLSFDVLTPKTQDQIKTAVKAQFLAEEKEYIAGLSEQAINKAFNDFEEGVLPYLDISADQRNRFFAAQNRTREARAAAEENITRRDHPRA